MKYKVFLGKVQEGAHLASLEEAVAAARGALSVLGQRLTAEERSDLAAQLPEEIGTYMSGEEPAERFDLDEFYRRVSEREGVDIPDAVHHAQVVVSVLEEAVSGGEWEDVRGQLPGEFDRLFSGDTL